jgi:hypothetical protein
MIIIIIEHDISTHEIHGPATESFPRYRSIEEQASVISLWNWWSWSYSRSWHHYTRSSWTCYRVLSSLSLYWRAGECDFIMINDDHHYHRSWQHYTWDSRTCDRVLSSLSLYWRASECDLIMINDDHYHRACHHYAWDSRTCDRVFPRYRSVEERASVISLW